MSITTPTLSWKEVVQRTDLVGGDVECIERGRVFRGPITRIEIEGEMIAVTTAWLAELHGADWILFSSEQRALRVNVAIVQPAAIGAGRIHYEVPFGSHYTLFPKGNNLDRKNVYERST